jgi:hypothetical protein
VQPLALSVIVQPEGTAQAAPWVQPVPSPTGQVAIAQMPFIKA